MIRSISGGPSCSRRITSAGGVFTAALRGLEGGRVTLQSSDGRTATLELAALSRNDRDYVRGKMGALAQRWLRQQSASAKTAPDRSGWPEVVQVPQESLTMKITRPFASGAGMKFASAHFEFQCPAEVSEAEQRSIATPFELIHEVWRLAPWGVFAPSVRGGPFQVELYLDAAAYEASGALKNTGAIYDRKAGKLRVLGSAIGLDAGRKPMWRDEQSPVTTLAYVMVPMMMHRFLAMIPDWVIPSLGLAINELPLCGECTRPQRMLAALAESSADTRLTEDEVRLFLDPVNNSENFPLAKEKLQRLASHFLQKDGSGGRNLGTFLTAVAADLPQWDAFLQRMEDIRSAEEKHKTDPSVVVPEMLPVPGGFSRLQQVRWFHVPKLLGGADVQSGLAKAVEDLTNPP